MMLTKRRADMKPGEVFGVRPHLHHLCAAPAALVVLDDKYEIEFWTGNKTCVGDVVSEWSFEVLA